MGGILIWEGSNGGFWIWSDTLLRLETLETLKTLREFDSSRDGASITIDNSTLWENGAILHLELILYHNSTNTFILSSPEAIRKFCSKAGMRYIISIRSQNLTMPGSSLWYTVLSSWYVILFPLISFWSIRQCIVVLWEIIFLPEMLEAFPLSPIFLPYPCFDVRYAAVMKSFPLLQFKESCKEMHWLSCTYCTHNQTLSASSKTLPR